MLMISKIKKTEKIMQYIWKCILEDGLCTASLQNYAEELFIAFIGGNTLSPIAIVLTKRLKISKFMVLISEPCMWFRVIVQSEFVYLVKMEIYMCHSASWRIKLQCVWGCWKLNSGAHCHRHHRWETWGTHTWLWEPVVCTGHAIQYL